MTEMDSEDRITALESRVAHYERMAEDLSDVIARQDRAIDVLTLQLHRLAERLRNLEAGADRSPQDDRPPPHY
jgi:SlyX protein